MSRGCESNLTQIHKQKYEKRQKLRQGPLVRTCLPRVRPPSSHFIITTVQLEMSSHASSFSGCIGQIDMSLSNTASRPHFAPHLSARPPPTVTYPPPSGDFYSLSLRLLSAGIAFNVLEGRSFTPCPPFPLHLIPISSIHFASKLF
jgi:hypothetical protein